MECNRDEALRAKQIAENKMKSNDFEGARKIALKAQNLYPELENISQLLSVCDVHCSAQKLISGSEKDWYGILQVETLADEATVKKQYRRLALFLHPDKNRFPGAEAAFKLICEANAVLSDTAKKTLYDSRIRVPVGSASVNLPPYHMNRNSQLNKQYGSHNSVYTHYSSLHQHQAAEPRFWTSCPFCSMKYQYDRKFVHTALRCQRCLKSFTGYETSAPPSGVPLGSTWAAPGSQQVPAKPRVDQGMGFQERGVPGWTGIHNVKGSSSKFKYQQSANVKPVQTEPGVRTKSVFEGIQVTSATNAKVDSKSKGNSNNVNSMHGGKCSSDAKISKRANLKNKSRKRGRKLIVESSESCDSSSDSDVIINESSRPSPVHFPRRSTRKRQNVSYHEGGDDDLPNHLKSLRASELSEDNEEELNRSDVKDSEHGNQSHRDMGSVHPEENVRDKDAVNCAKEVKKRGGRGGTSSTGVDPIEIESDCDLDSSSNGDPAGETWACPDPDFNDFEKRRAQKCFAVNQFWACYDEVDSMPRFYAKVKKVRRSPFELSIIWLEADPVDGACRNWRDAKLPIGCGNFKLGETLNTSALETFSHQIHCDEGKRRNTFIIYPRQGEVWAVFKDWHLSWASDPENHREYKYEIVEVLSEFDVSNGIKVSYLDKVKGFVSLFERSSQSETSSFLVRPDEIYKFSHPIPFYTMTGSERQGVPIGSFELDPASLPLNPDDLHYPGKGKMETKNMDPGLNSAPPELTVEKGQPIEISE